MAHQSSKPAGATRHSQRREKSLTRDQIVQAAIELLDNDGEAGLTFRALSERLATGPGAIYRHITDKNDLLFAACDTILARTTDAAQASTPGQGPQATIRLLALAIFDAIDAHPWIGSALARAPGQMPMIRIVESLGRQLRALAVPDDNHWIAASTLLHFILGVGERNAANGQLARTQDLDRTDFLHAASRVWSQLDPEIYPFARSLAAKLRVHDDRRDFLVGIDIILKGIDAQQDS